jgi:hypothetical protein
MMRKRWILSGAAVVALLAALAGIGYAAGSGSRSAVAPTNTGVAGPMMTARDVMHDSPGMRAMHDRMPAALRAQCDAIYEQMDEMMGGSGMMGGLMASHHPTTEG